jgi:outer membrane protein insertion porin family
MNYLLLLLTITLSGQLSTQIYTLGSFNHFCSLLEPQSSPGQEIQIEELEIRGNRRISRDMILATIKSRPGAQYNAAQVQQDLETLCLLGVFDPLGTKVVENTGPRGGKHIVFEVKEYPIIRELRFEGLKSVSARDVAKLFEEKEIDLRKESLFIPEKIDTAKKALGELLAVKGRANANITVEAKRLTAVTVVVIFKIEE